MLAASSLPTEALGDVFFDYDRFTLRSDAKTALESNARVLKARNGTKLLIEGHCDERGSEAYNMALGDARAKSAKDYLVGVGISSAQLNVVSYGKDKPVCEDHDEACWQKNRRIHIVATK